MRASLRIKILLVVLAALAILVVVDGDSSGASTTSVVKAVASAPRSKSDGAPTDNQSVKPAMILALQARTRSEEQKDINAFPKRDWTPPPPPPPPAPPPPPPAPPQAPPLPFSFLGKIIEGKQWTVFLAQQDRTHAVVAGDMIGHEYKVYSIAPPMMILTYLPLKQTQSLPIGLAE